MDPRTTRPCSTIWLYTRTARLDGKAKPTPALTPFRLMMAVLMPITSPAKLTSGPPELPRLMAASVWMKR